MGRVPNPKKKIAVIDHDHLHHKLMLCYSAFNGEYELAFMSSLDEGLEQIKIKEYDLVLLENRLQPYQDYRDTVPMIREAGYGGRLVVMSADIRVKEFAHCKAYAIDKYIDKLDFELSTFNSFVGSLME